MSSLELDSPPSLPPSAFSSIDDEEIDNVECGYDFQFIDDLRDEHRCPVCLHAIKNAVQTKCGHRFCEDCLLNTFRRADREGVQWCCPQDRTPLPTYLGEYRCKMKEHYAQDSPHLFKACKELQKLKQTVSGYGSLQQRVATLEVEKQAMERALNKSRQEIQELRAKEREKSYMLTQLKTQLAELDRGKTKIQFLEKRVEQMEDRFQAVGYALGFGDGKEQSKKANGSKRKAEVKTLPYSPRKKMGKVQHTISYESSEDED